MSSHDSNSEKAPSDRAESPEQVERDENVLPKHNPSNIDNNATTSSTTTAQKAQKKPKKSASTQEAAAAMPPEDDYAELQAPAAAEQQNTDTRPGGGFINPDNARPKMRKMKWTDEKDRQLLIFGLGRDISGGEYQAIADSFPEQPTAKAVQERLTKLRVLCRKALKDTGIFDADAVQPAPASSVRRTRSIGQAASSPLQPPPKKARPSSSSSASRGAANPPPQQGAGTPGLRASQQAPPPSQSLPSQQMPQLGSQFFQTPTANLGGPTWLPRPFANAAMASLQSYPSQQMGSPRVATAHMVPQQMGASSYQAYTPTPFAPTHQTAPMYPGAGTGMRLNPYQFPQRQQHQPLSPFMHDPFASPHVPAAMPAGAPVAPSALELEEPAEEEDGLFERTERELEERKARREAERRALGL